MDKQLLTKEFYSTKELAEISKLAQDYVRQLILAGKIKAQKVGSFWIVSRAEVIRFLSGREE